MSEASRIKAQAILALVLGLGATLVDGPALPNEPDFDDMRIAPPLEHRRERGHPLNPGKGKRK